MRIEDDFLLIPTENGWEYDIPMRDMNTPDGLQKWVCHMVEKRWFTDDMARQLIQLCEDHFGYQYSGKMKY